MKVLHLNDYPLDAGGGAEVVMRQTIDLLRAAGHVVDTFTSADIGTTLRTPLRYISNRYARRALRKKLATFRPQVVHLHNWYHVLSPVVLAVLEQYKQERPLRVVMTAHDYHLVSPNSGGSSFSWWSGQRQAMDRECLHSWAYLLTRSWDQRSCVHSALKLLQQVWHYRWHSRQQVIDHAICPSRFVQSMLAPTGLLTSWLPHPAPSIRTPTPRMGQLRFVFAGRIEPEKGLAELLQAVPDDFAADWTIIGGGSDEATCRTIAARRPWRERVQFVGRLSHAETMNRIADCHVLVQPSRVLETYGLTLIEALSAGANLLVSDRGALREIVADSGVGFLYDVDRPASLVEQLRAIEHCHAAGSLNRFNIAPFLAQRSAARYLAGLLRLYSHDADASYGYAA